jgi:hypothetical protein
MQELPDRPAQLVRPGLRVSRVARPGRPELLVIQQEPLVMLDPPAPRAPLVLLVWQVLLALSVLLALLVLLVLPE